MPPLILLTLALRAGKLLRAVFRGGDSFVGDIGARHFGDEAVAEASTVEGGVAGVLPGDLQGNNSALPTASAQAEPEPVSRFLPGPFPDFPFRIGDDGSRESASAFELHQNPSLPDAPLT